MFHLIRTPWKLSQNSPKEESEITLGDKAISLSKAVLDLYYTTVKPEMPTRGLWADSKSLVNSLYETNTWTQKMNRYNEEMAGVYKYRFARDVVAAVKSMHAEGVACDEADPFWNEPQNAPHVRSIGENLGLLADELSKNVIQK
jgi:hypothetical protein